MITGIVPAAGTATRLSGLPKFLLPILEGSGDKGSTLLDYHIQIQQEICDRVVVATRPEFAPLVSPIVQRWDCHLMVQISQTMSETVLNVHDLIQRENYFISMPDTFFDNGIDTRAMLGEIGFDAILACWKVHEELRGRVGEVELNDAGIVVRHEDKNSDSRLPLMWGTMLVSAAYLELVRPEDPHVGIALNRAIDNRQMLIGGKQMPGNYLDLGTPSGLRRYLGLSKS